MCVCACVCVYICVPVCMPLTSPLPSLYLSSSFLYLNSSLIVFYSRFRFFFPGLFTDHHKTVLTLILPDHATAVKWRRIIEERVIHIDADSFMNSSSSGNSGNNSNIHSQSDSNDSHENHDNHNIVVSNHSYNNNNNNSNSNNSNYESNKYRNKSNIYTESKIEKNIKKLVKLDYVNRHKNGEEKCFNNFLVIPTSGLSLNQTETLKIEIARTMSLAVRT